MRLRIKFSIRFKSLLVYVHTYLKNLIFNESFSLFMLFFFILTIPCLVPFSLVCDELNLNTNAQLVAGIKASDPQAFYIENSDQWREGIAGQTAKYFWDLAEWNDLENQLNKTMLKRAEIESFLANHLSEAYFHTKGVLYLFGGPDFCYPDLFFPNMEKIVIIGQETIGEFPNVHDLYQRGILSQVMLEIGHSLADIPFKSYFVTLKMNEEFKNYGVATILAVSIALAGYQIVDYQEVFLNEEGIFSSQSVNSSSGLKIVYRKEVGDIDRTIYYFRLNLTQSKNFSRLKVLFNNLRIDTAFYKATSFKTQSSEMLQTNQLVLDQVKYIVQSESGIPYCYFYSPIWDIKLFGIYARPYYSNQAIPKNWGLQEDLRNIYLSLIQLSGSGKIKKTAKKIWGKEIYAQALNTPIPPSISWEGILPFRFDYGGQLTEDSLKPYTSTLQFIIKNKL
jgi:hypothetical protein